MENNFASKPRPNKSISSNKESLKVLIPLILVIELGPNSNIITKDDCPIRNDEIINKMIRFRFIIYLNEIDEIPTADCGVNYFMEFSIFGKKARYKLDTSMVDDKIIPLKKLKVIYFFANSVEEVEDYAKSAANFRINIVTETKDAPF